MKYYIVQPKDKYDIHAVVLNKKNPFQIDFKHLSGNRGGVVNIKDCNKTYGNVFSAEEYQQYGITRDVIASSILVSSACFETLSDYFNFCFTKKLDYNGLIFYFLLVKVAVPFDKNDKGEKIRSHRNNYAARAHEKRPEKAHLFDLESKRSLYCTQIFKDAVEKDKLKPKWPVKKEV